MPIKEFNGKVVVVTGAGSGMGRAYAIEFAKLGSKLALNDINPNDLAETEQAVRGIAEVELLTSVFDVSDRSAMDAFAGQVKEQLGDAHVVISNAGIEGVVEPVYHMEVSEIRRIMDVNFFGVVNGTMAFLPQLVGNGEGAVVNVSSVFGLIGTPANADYCASKFAVRGFTEALMAEFQESPITIHCVHPGGIDTKIVRNEAGKAFAEKYLITPPEKIVKHVIKCIKRGQPKIVYGNNSLKVWIGANLVPQRLINWLVWRELKRVGDTSRYGDFIGSQSKQ